MRNLPREEWPQARGNSSLKAKDDIKSWPAIGGPQKAVRRSAPSYFIDEKRLRWKGRSWPRQQAPAPPRARKTARTGPAARLWFNRNAAGATAPERPPQPVSAREILTRPNRRTGICRIGASCPMIRLGRRRLKAGPRQRSLPEWAKTGRAGRPGPAREDLARDETDRRRRSRAHRTAWLGSRLRD